MRFSRTAVVSFSKRPKYTVKYLAMKVEIFVAVQESKLSCQTNVSFSDIVDIDNGVCISGVFSNSELINAVLDNDKDDNESDV